MSKNCTLASRNCSRTSKIVLATVKMVEVLIGELLDAESHTRSVILESMVVERSYVYTPIFYHLVALWRSGENIAPILRILHTEGQKTTQSTIRRCKKDKKSR